MEIKIGRGQKLCTHCNTINGVRSFNCKNCTASFYGDNKKPQKAEEGEVNNPPQEIAVKKRKRRRKLISRFTKEIVRDWTLLKPGDTVKIKQGTGPYFTNPDGERSYVNAGGLITVYEHANNGFWARYQKSRKDCGEFFVYMGQTCRSPVLESLIRRRHKLIKITPKILP